MGFVLVMMIATSCLKSENDTIYYGVDTSVRAFSIDTINGKKYKFSIDNLNSLIYNQDSLPYLSDTLMSNFLVDTFTVAGYVAHNDSLFSAPVYTDLRGAINGKGEIVFKVYAIDQVTTRNFKLNVNIHKQDPDSLVWKQMGGIPQQLQRANMGSKVKAVTTGDALYIYDYSNLQNIKVYSTFTYDPTNYIWNEQSVRGLTTNAKMSDIVSFNEKLYVATEEGDVYYTSDGASWQKDESLSGNIGALIASSSVSLMGISEGNEGKSFCYTDIDASAWTLGEKVPESFPTENISYSAQTTSTGVEKVTLVGMPLSNDTELVPWFTFLGDGWAELNTESMYCPVIENASLMYCDNYFYIFGSGLDVVYTSISGLVWKKVTSKFMLPKEMSGQQNYAMAIDADQFIWIVISENGANQVWRGRINKLGFARQ